MQKHVSELFAERWPGYSLAPKSHQELVDLGASAALRLIEIDLKDILACNRFAQEQAVKHLLTQVKFLLEDA